MTLIFRANNLIKTLCTICLISLASSANLARAEEDSLVYANALSSAFENAARNITPSVVTISSVRKAKPIRNMQPGPGPNPFDPLREFFGDDLFDRMFPNQSPEDYAQQGLGTGVIIDAEGRIVTNNHVIGDADDVTVRLPDDRTVKAEIVGRDPKTDLAVIKIKSGNLSPAKLGDSDKLKIGEWVVAAGNPFGLDNTITAGIVSAKGRSIMGGSQYEDFIQTDAAINPGNSGGPLLNLRGEVVGINTAIFSRSGGYMGIGFAIPINMVRSIMQSLIDNGKVVRGWLGVGIQNLSEDLAKSFNYPGTEGALVGHIQEDTPAQSAGLKQGDIIVKIDDQKILNINQLRNLVASLTPGKSVAIEYVRNGRKESTTAKIGEQPAQASVVEQMASPEEGLELGLGIAVQNLTPELARQLRTRRQNGVVINHIQPTGLAASAGLQAGDIIISINGKAIKSTKDFRANLNVKALKEGVRIVVESQGMERFVFIKSED